ncbi:hypothetical protein ABB30_11515 [Stenotrophomonas ginsengisoli]|uniref:Transmembrane protein n=1 Tax=Stenotrophomonas ginsengisoli TaxID=336566 RepID=A0A0R0D2M7_9GAMM|nr:hypothetical protein ABB30_11515 [Stenotrophomonas ginsengisoli]
MSKLSNITDTALERVLELAGQAGGGLKQGGSHAADWLKTGAAIGALKTGGRVATKAVRRNPGAAVAVAAVGLGVLGYAAYRKRKKAQEAAAQLENNRRIADRPHSHVDDAADLGE